MLNLTKINIQKPGQFFHGVSFEHDGTRYTANVGIDGRESNLWAFGAPGDDCVTTYPVENPELLAVAVALVR